MQLPGALFKPKIKIKKIALKKVSYIFTKNFLPKLLGNPVHFSNANVKLKKLNYENFFCIFPKKVSLTFRDEC